MYIYESQGNRENVKYRGKRKMMVRNMKMNRNENIENIQNWEFRG